MTDPEAKAREITNQWTAPEHEHWAGSVYVRCKDCLTFGIPMPGEYQCGNCNSKNTVSYNPPCCVATALRKYGEVEFKRGRDQERESVIQYGKEQRFKADAEGYRRGIEDAAIAALTHYRYDTDAVGSRRELECSQRIADAIRALTDREEK